MKERNEERERERKREKEYKCFKFNYKIMIMNYACELCFWLILFDISIGCFYRF